MKINGISAEQYGVQQWNVTPGFCEIKNNSEWIEGALSPLMVKSTVGMKMIKVDIIIRGKTRAEIWEKSSDFIAKLLEPCTIELDGFDHQFYMVLQNATQAERSLQRWHRATLELIGYEHAKESWIKTENATFSVFNAGNLVTPAIIEIEPQFTLSAIGIFGFARDELTGEDIQIVIGNVKKDTKIIIDGETGLITEAGKNKFPEMTIQALPSLLPGTNKITMRINDGQALTTVRYKPRFL